MIIGCLAMLAAGGILLLVAVTSRAGATHDVSGLIWPASAVTVFAIGVVFRKRWAVLGIGVVLAIVAAAFVVVSFSALPNAWPLLNLVTAAFVGAPAVLLFRYRDSLR